MQTIEKINGLFKSIRIGLSKSLDFIVKIKDILWFVVIVVISLFLISQCNSRNELEKEINILTNNTYALTDTIRHYHDKSLQKPSCHRRRFPPHSAVEYPYDASIQEAFSYMQNQTVCPKNPLP